MLLGSPVKFSPGWMDAGLRGNFSESAAYHWGTSGVGRDERRLETALPDLDEGFEFRYY